MFDPSSVKLHRPFRLTSARTFDLDNAFREGAHCSTLSSPLGPSVPPAWAALLSTPPQPAGVGTPSEAKAVRLGPVFGRGWAKHRFEEHVRHIPNRRGWTKPDTIPPSHQTNHLGSSRVNEVCCSAPKPVLPCAFASALSMGINLHGVRINQHCQHGGPHANADQPAPYR